MNETTVTVVGNIASDVTSRRVGADEQYMVVGFRVASSQRRYDRVSGTWVDGDRFSAWVRCWRRLGESVVTSLVKGDPVIVNGRLSVREYEIDGQRRFATEIAATSVGPDLARCAAKPQPRKLPAVDPGSGDGGDDASALRDGEQTGGAVLGAGSERGGGEAGGGWNGSGADEGRHDAGRTEALSAGPGCAVPGSPGTAPGVTGPGVTERSDVGRSGVGDTTGRLPGTDAPPGPDAPLEPSGAAGPSGTAGPSHTADRSDSAHSSGRAESPEAGDGARDPATPAAGASAPSDEGGGVGSARPSRRARATWPATV